MESHFSQDFSSVRVHEDSRPESIGALAFARGEHLHFAPGLFQPHTSGGRKILSHELAHVVQQRLRRVPRAPAFGTPVNADPVLEAEADRSARAASAPVAAPEGAQSRTAAAPADCGAIQPMLASRGFAARTAGFGLGGKGGGGGRPPWRPFFPLTPGHYIDTPRQKVPYTQKRKIHIGFQGSGVPKEARSNVTAINEAYEGPNKLVIGGPGKSGHDWKEWPSFGATQTEQGQEERLQEATRALIEARKSGDEQIHITGHSRGAGNALLLAQRLHARGLVDPDTGEQVAPPGVPVHSLNLLDAVPHMGSRRATAVSPIGGTENVPYEALRVPPNVQLAQHLLAGGEKRTEFQQADIPAESPGTHSTHTIVPNATHSEVGGRPGGNPDAIALSLSEALRNLRQGGLPFSGASVLALDEHNRRLARLQRTAPQPGAAERLIGLLTGNAGRDFPPYARPLSPGQGQLVPVNPERPLAPPNAGPPARRLDVGRERQHDARIKRLQRKLQEIKEKKGKGEE
jgi:hypothetical protein